MRDEKISWFFFTGSAAEKAMLRQTVDITGVAFSTGDTLTLSAFVKGNNPTAKTVFLLTLTYAGNPTPVKHRLVVKRNTTYTQAALVAPISSAAVTDMKVTVKHKSTAGAVWIDDMRLLHEWQVTRSPGGSAGLLPPPVAPDGFRGTN